MTVATQTPSFSAAFEVTAFHLIAPAKVAARVAATLHLARIRNDGNIDQRYSIGYNVAAHVATTSATIRKR